MTDERKSKRGPKPLDVGEKRTHTVSVRLNPAELEMLDSKRGPLQRGEWLRVAALDKLPHSIPPLNAQAYAALARSAANLNQLAHRVNAGEQPAISELAELLSEFRQQLLGAKL